MSVGMRFEVYNMLRVNAYNKVYLKIFPESRSFNNLTNISNWQSIHLGPELFAALFLDFYQEKNIKSYRLEEL
jgi:hypothetical protein